MDNPGIKYTYPESLELSEAQDLKSGSLSGKRKHCTNAQTALEAGELS